MPRYTPIMRPLHLGLLLTLLTLLGLPTAGCLTHVPPNALSPHRYESLPWAADLDEAMARGRSADRPVMLILVSGARSGFC
jgi:hypothetical protein